MVFRFRAPSSFQSSRAPLGGWCASGTMGARPVRPHLVAVLCPLLLVLLAIPEVAPSGASETTSHGAPSPSTHHQTAPKPSTTSNRRHSTQTNVLHPVTPTNVRFTVEAELKFSQRLASVLRNPCEVYARNFNHESAFDLQHAAVVALRLKCSNAPSSIPGQTRRNLPTENPCADLTNAVNVVLTHREAVELLTQLLHEKCQFLAVGVSLAAGGANARAKSRYGLARFPNPPHTDCPYGHTDTFRAQPQGRRGVSSERQCHENRAGRGNVARPLRRTDRPRRNRETTARG